MKMSCSENNILLSSIRCSKARITTSKWSSPHPRQQCAGWRIWTLTARRSTSSQVKDCHFTTAVVFGRINVWSNHTMLLVTAFTAKHLPVGTCFTQGYPFSDRTEVYKPWLIDVQCAEFTAGFQYSSLLSNELAEQATLKEKKQNIKERQKMNTDNFWFPHLRSFQQSPNYRVDKAEVCGG